MWLLYDLLIHLYGDAISVAALFNPKARAWVRGRKGLFASIQSAVGSRQSAANLTPLSPRPPYPPLLKERGQGGEVVWFHCASLGEFEQGRPVLEAFRKQYPGWKILLTFFSPSGYEIRKNYEGADWVFYLPLDTPWNARKFVRIVRPALAVFVKYEFWFRYLDFLHRDRIPVFVISANFRKNHHFFKWHGGWARKQLKKVTGFFVQHEDSAVLLRNYGVDQVTVSGDTRFDRVATISSNARDFPLVKKFAGQMPVFLAGSTWPEDEDLILKLIDSYGAKMKFIIAPHEVGVQRVDGLRSAVGGQRSAVSGQRSVVSGQRSAVGGRRSVGRSSIIDSGTGNPEPETVLFSGLTDQNAASARVLIIDGIGYLSHLYQYATIAYIGGGFGVGIHNILEAAAFGKPVLFGPAYEKFREAVELIAAGGAYSVADFEQLNNRTIELIDNQQIYKDSSRTCSDYIQQKKGATGIIIKTLDQYLATKTQKH